MLKKRIIGTVLVKNGIAVQSLGYSRWLPLGDPLVLIQNLERWGVDGITLLCIDRGNSGPDIALIKSIAQMGLSTPFSYGGGICDHEHARLCVNLGVERIILDRVLMNSYSVCKIADTVGTQAMIASLPLLLDSGNNVNHINYVTRKKTPIAEIMQRLSNFRFFSELLFIDYIGEGFSNGFDSRLISLSKSFADSPILCFGGISTAQHIKQLLELPQVKAILIGNSLNYRESSIYHLKASLADLPLRPHSPFYL